jgi:TrkA domain protein
MERELRADELPGVGVRYGLPLAEGGRLAIVERDDGVCELYHFAEAADEEPAAVITLQPDEARQAASVMGGAYRRSGLVQELEIALGELVLEWVRVPRESPLAGRSIGETRIRKRTGATVIAIARSPDPVSAVQPEDVIRPGDVLVAAGRVEQVRAFRELVGAGPGPA